MCEAERNVISLTKRIRGYGLSDGLSRVTSAIGHGACKPRDRHWKCKLRLAREDTTRESRKKRVVHV